MRNHNLVYAAVFVLTILGIWSLPRMNKDEFPQFTIRQGIVAAVYPGATAQEIEEQVTRPLEDYLNGFVEVNKEKTSSVTEDGLVYVFVWLRNDVESSSAHGLLFGRDWICTENYTCQRAYCKRW